MSLKNATTLAVTVLIENTADSNIGSLPKHILHEDDVVTQVHGSTELGRYACKAIDGLSLHLRITEGMKTVNVLYDTGPDFEVLKQNAETLGIDLLQIDCIVISHGHFDHVGCLRKLLEYMRHSGVKPDVFMDADALRKRGLQQGDGTVRTLGSIPTIDSVTDLANTSFPSGSQCIANNLVYFSGRIERHYDQESLALHKHMSACDDGTWHHDPFVVDERYIAVNVTNKGLILFSACSHAGISNIIRDANNYFPNLRIYAIIGGWHTLRKPELIATFIDRLSALPHPVHEIILGHCSGPACYYYLLQNRNEIHVSPEAQTINLLTVGRQYVFSDV